MNRRQINYWTVHVGSGGNTLGDTVIYGIRNGAGFVLVKNAGTNRDSIQAICDCHNQMLLEDYE